MNTIPLTNNMNYSVTSVPNIFLDKYMPGANGEFVKVYLYLLRIMNNGGQISICGIADALNHTEKDVMRALRYWEQNGLISLSFSDNKELSGISMLSPELQSPTSAEYHDPFSAITAQTEPIPSVTEEKPIPVPVNEKKVSKKHTYTTAELNKFKEQDEVSELLYIVEKYIGKTLSSTDINSLLYIYDELGFSRDLIEYLIEYCVGNGHRSMRYIEKVALSWAEEGIETIEDAKSNTDSYVKTCYPVLKAFGLSGRNPGKSEKDFIIKWTTSYGFTMDIILDACNRTIQAIHQPSFEYADTILSKWSKNGIHKLDDVKKLDEEFDRKKERKSAEKSAGANTSNTFNDFSQRTYDYDALEKKLLAKR